MSSTNSASERPILVTGAHRSGTTWVGKMLAAEDGVAYISEPLNVLHRPGVMRAPIKHWYTYICADNEDQYLPALREMLEFDYHLGAELRSLRSRRDLLRMVRDFHSFFVGNMHGERPLLKDPFAVFSAPWCSQRLDCQVVITVRHPAGFASSLKWLGWAFDFSDLLAQPLLMRDHLEADRDAMQNMDPNDIIAQSALLWKLIYRTVHEYSQAHPEFHVVRHDDFALDPVACFRDLYGALGLRFSAAAERKILESSSS
ncbi:MAG TPA: sulfotransferase, partial [Anaerolineales bacterium]